MAEKVDMSVVRNAQYRRGGLSVRQRHNERQNMDYMNDDIIKERAAYNVYFKEPQGSYEQMFDTMVADKTISTRGLGKDPFIVDELVFDVNTAYFDSRGGYEYAKSFFEEAYRCAVEEIDGEQYVLSAVMHADERNKALSELHGRDIYHYHLHVVYVPVVDKEIYFRKNNKDPEKAGKLREVIKQVSHSKKWPKLKRFDDNGEIVRNVKGKAVLVNSYSLLQDHFHKHMTEAGFVGFERGERGSIAEHLSVVEYKTLKETERAAAMTAVVKEMQDEAASLSVMVEQKQETAAKLDTAITQKAQKSSSLDKSVKKKQETLKDLTEKTAVAENEYAKIEDIEKLGHKRTITGAVTIPGKMWTKIFNLIKEAFQSRHTIADYRKQNSEKALKIFDLEEKLKAKEQEKPRITDSMEYAIAKARAPRRLTEVIADIMRQPSEYEQQRQNRANITTKKKSHEL
jgi:hypothetical protein